MMDRLCRVIIAGVLLVSAVWAFPYRGKKSPDTPDILSDDVSSQNSDTMTTGNLKSGETKAEGGDPTGGFGQLAGSLPGLMNNTAASEGSTMVLGGFSLMIMPMPAMSDMGTLAQNGMPLMQNIPGFPGMPGGKK